MSNFYILWDSKTRRVTWEGTVKFKNSCSPQEEDNKVNNPIEVGDSVTNLRHDFLHRETF
jgi:hypothetical protein